MKSAYKLTALFIISMLGTFSNGQPVAGVPNTSAYKSDTTERPAKNKYDFFASDELLEITLCFDIREFIKSKYNPTYYDARITVRINESDSITQDIKLKARGEMRRDYCSFPPIMLKFKGGDSTSALKLGKGTMKLVTHCNKTPLFESYIIKEFLTYKLYNLVTPYSFRTRLVKINYVDINKAKNSFVAYGFLIENEDQLAERSNAVILNNTTLTQKQMDTEDMARVAVFNYMIGNTDWAVPSQHNIKIMKSLEVPSDRGIPVAYDFDYSGLVNTVYSTPNEQLPIKIVTERYYQGLCFSDEELQPIIDEFAGKQEQILGTIDNFEYLSNGDKKQVTYFINSFYKLYKSKNYLMSDLNRTCKRF